MGLEYSSCSEQPAYGPSPEPDSYSPLIPPGFFKIQFKNKSLVLKKFPFEVLTHSCHPFMDFNELTTTLSSR
jgi:hypothetical protein